MLQKVATAGVDLETVYSQTLRRIKEQKGGRSRLGIEVLMWVSHAERPLQIDELRHALAVEMGATDTDLENIRPQDTVLGSCLGLVVVDKETSTVRLIHYTLQEYLSRPEILPDAHKTLAQSCLTYLNYDQVKGRPANNVSNLGETPFLEYSSHYWGGHAKMELSNPVRTLALELLGRYDNHISSTLLLDKIQGYHAAWRIPYMFTGLHCVSYLGIDEIVDALIQIKGRDINQPGYKGRRPLTWAAQQGNQRAVTILLTRDDTDSDKPDRDGRTPLWWTSRNGHQGVVGLLLARDDVNPDKPDNDGATPLSAAAREGHEGAMILLLARHDVNPDQSDSNGRTPLWWASFHRHEGVVRLLLARNDVDPDKPGKYGGAPLWWASFHGYKGVVRLLLARDDVNPDKPGNDGETPLCAASSNGNEGVVGLLLARYDVNLDKPNNDGETPLWRASENGHEGVVRLLLARDDVNPNRPNNYGQTPLDIALGMGNQGVVKLLLSQRYHSRQARYQ